MGTSTGQVVTPFSLMGGGSAPVSTPFSLGTNTAGTASAMSALNNSTSGLNTNFSLAPLQGYQNPGYQNLGANIPWNLTGSDFGNPNATAASNANTPGNFFSNVWNGVSNFFNKESSALSNVWGGSGGILDNMKGIADLYHGNTQQAVSESPNAQSPVDLYSQGWSNPSQTPSWNSNFGRLTGSTNPIVNAVGGFALGGLSDPLSYVPVGAIAKATGIPSALKFGVDWAKGAVKGADAVGDVAKGAGAVGDASKVAVPENPYASDLQDIASQKADVQTQHDQLAKSLLSEMNASKDQGILSELQNAGVRRPLQGDAFYNEYKALPPSVQRLFQPGNVGKGALSLDEFAAQKGTDAASLLDSLNGAKKTYSMADVLGSPALEDHQQALSMLDKLLNETQAAHDAWNPEEFAQAAKESAPTAEDVVTQAAKGSNPYAAYDWQSKLGAPIARLLTEARPDGIPGLKQLLTGTENIMGKMFNPIHGVSQPIVDAVKNALGMRASDRFYIDKTMTDLAKNHALNSDELEQLPHVLEGTLSHDQVSPKVVQAASDLRDVLENGIKLPNSERILGTQHELRTVDANGKQLLDSAALRPNYFPHFYTNNQKEIDSAFARNSNRGISTTGPQNMERKFDTIKEAQDAGLKPMTNSYKVIGKRLENSSSAIRNAELLNALTKSGELVKGDTVDNIIKDVKTGKASMEDAINNAYHDTGDKAVPGMVQSKIAQLRGNYMTPADEAFLRSFVEPTTHGPIVKGLNALTGLFKHFFLMNPAMHFHNIEVNGRYLGGASAKYAKVAKQAIKNKIPEEWYMKAMRDGALTSDSGRGFLDSMNKSIDKVSATQTPWMKMKGAYNAVTHDSLWNEDKALRVALYRQGYEDAMAKGASEAEAGAAGAARANKYMVNYNNLTPFEKNYVQHLFTFYPWMKGNLALQADQLVNNTGKVLAYEKAKDAVAEGLTGQHTNDKGEIDSGITLPDGNHLYVNPMSPMDEIPKILQEGIGPFMFGKVNPFIKTAVNVYGNHKYNPWDTSPIWNSGAPDTANLASEASTIGGTFNPFSGGVIGKPIGEAEVGKPVTPASVATEGLTQLLGGSTSRANPLMDAYYKQLDANAQKQAVVKYDKANGIPVSKQQTKDAYAKVKRPVVTSPLGN